MSQSATPYSLNRTASPLEQWLHQTIARTGINVQYRLRGNALHLLCRQTPCPDRIRLLRWLVPLLQNTDFSTLLPLTQPPLYQIWLYGCLPEDNCPRWVTPLHLHQLDQHLEQLHQAEPALAQAAAQTIAQTAPLRSQQAVLDSTLTTAHPAAVSSPNSTLSAVALSNAALAKRGDEMAIACYLSETLNELGVAVRVSAKAIPYTPAAMVHTETKLTVKRLWIACQAAYSPEPSLLCEPITQRLRQLEIEGFHDAVILFQVTGETKPDWTLRVDLTPPNEMLREWARWGDVEAIQRWLNQEIADLNLRITTATLNTTTLHLCCSSLNPEAPQLVIQQHKRAKAEIALLLEAIAPQGIHAVTLYGQVPQQDSPVWIEWLELPATEHRAFAEPAITLAKQADWGAIAFLLHRLLNADLDHYLSTGGIRLQLLPKQDLLHVMSEASRCPDRKQVVAAVVPFLRQLELPEVDGVRIYGRRAGQKKPMWSYGVDFATRTRLVPEVAPEFAATDAYVSDLLPQPGETVLRPDLTPAELQHRWNRWQQTMQQTMQQALLRTQLFTFAPSETATALPGQTDFYGKYGKKVALVWGTAGLLLLLQTNWLLSQISRWQSGQSGQPKSVAVAPSPAVPAPLPSPNITFKDAQTDFKDAQAPQDGSVFNTSSFTRAGSAPISQSPDNSIGGSTDNSTHSTHSTNNPAVQSVNQSTKLPYTPHTQAETALTAEILAESPPFPSFNSQQMDQKLQLYYRYVEKYGAPDVLIIGSSRALRGVDPGALRTALSNLGYSNLSIFNLGVNGATAQLVNLLVQRILTPEQLPRLILWADGARAFNSGGTDVTYNGVSASEAYQQLLAGTLPIPTRSMTAAQPAAPPDSINRSLTDSYKSIDRWLSQQLASLTGRQTDRDQLKHWLQQSATRLLPIAHQEPLTSAMNVRDADQAKTSAAEAEQANRVNQLLQARQTLPDQQGFLSLAVQFNPATYYQKYARVLGAYDADYANFRVEGSQTEALQSLLKFTQSRQIPIVFVNLPLTEDYLDSKRLEHEQVFHDYMVQFGLNHPDFIFRNLSQEWTTQYGYFSDPSHLNRYGAYAVSQKLAQDIKIPWEKAKRPATGSATKPETAGGS
jgi:hypothetical protein